MLNALRKGFGLTFKSMFRPPVTYQYPEQPKPVAPRYHGRHVLNRHPDGLEKCVGCELCAWACPADAIYVEGADNTPEERYSPGDRYGRVYQINYLRCIFCGLCIEACPTRALTMSQNYDMSFDNRDDFILTRGQLLAPLPEGAKPPPHTDAEVAARGLTYYEGWAAQAPTSARADWERLQQEDLATYSAEFGGPEDYGDAATVAVGSGRTEPPGADQAPKGQPQE